MSAKACIHDAVDTGSTTSNQTQQLLLSRFFPLRPGLLLYDFISFRPSWKAGGCGYWLALAHPVEGGCHVCPGLLSECLNIDDDSPRPSSLRSDHMRSPSVLISM